MIRQLCPHCQKLVELPDTAAGGLADCPQCQKPIAVPSAYSPGVATDGGVSALPPVLAPAPVPAAADPFPPPPGFRPPSPPAPPASPAEPLAPPPLVPVPSGYGRVAGLTLSPGWLAWVPVACVSLAFALTLFTWAGTFPGGNRVYTQTPWWALFGEMTTNIAPASALKDETEIEKLLTGNRWLIGYLPLLLASVGLLWLERVVKNPTVMGMPGPLAWVPGMWPKRFGLLTVLTGLLLLFLAMQALRGFGLETALRERATAKFKAEQDAATATIEKQAVAVQIGEDFARFHYQTTTAFAVAVAAHVLAFLASVGRWWLHRRGNKPLPRLLLQW